ncbi:MAG: VOC family protein [Myxococcales bacterium]|nr:VOC family protein [Myxococcales bacterium]
MDVWSRWLRVRRVLRLFGRPRLRALDHVTIPVHDLAAARAFYCDVLGAEYMMTIDAAALARFGRPPAPADGDGVFHVSVLLAGSTRLDLFQQRSGQPGVTQGHPHYAFRVPPRDILRWKALLEAHHVPTEGPLQLGPPGQASLYFNDPSGNHLEICCLGFSGAIPVRPPEMTGLTWRSPAARMP